MNCPIFDCRKLSEMLMSSCLKVLGLGLKKNPMATRLGKHNTARREETIRKLALRAPWLRLLRARLLRILGA